MISLSILQTHEPKNLRKFISEANKRIRATISAEIKEERKKFSIKMMEKRKIEKEKRIIKIPSKSKKEDLIKVIMDNKKHFKEIKKNVTKQDKIKDLENEINEMKNKIKELNSKELNELSKKYMDFKKLAGLENKKFKGIVKEIYKREQDLKKPKIPSITITEEKYKPDGGGKADPKAKEFKIPKPTAKLRIVPKKPKAQLGQSGLGEKRKREEGKPKKKKIINVEVKEKPKPPKPKIPSITITEEEKPKRKVLKVGGRFITPKPKKEVKSSLPPIQKTKNKIRLPKKEPASVGHSKPKKETVEEQVRRALSETDKKIEKQNKKSKPPTIEAERIPEMVKEIEKRRKKGDPAKGLELQLKELIRDFDLSEFKLPGQVDKPKKPKKKKESTIQRIRRERGEALERDKGKVIPQVSELPKKSQTEFFKYLKEENESGFTLEDQSDLYEYMEDLSDRLPKERKARQELNEFDKERLVLFESLFPKDYIKYIDVENDFTNRKEKLVAAQEKKASAEEARSQKARDKESRAIAKKMEKQKETDKKQKTKDQKEYQAYIKKNPFKTK